MRDGKNWAEKPIMRHFSGHKIDDMHFVACRDWVERAGLIGNW